MSKKKRADELVALQGLAPTKDMASRLIMAKQIVVSGIEPQIFVDKPGTLYYTDTAFDIFVKNRFVSRGGDKLLSAVNHFKIDPTGFTCLDAGASTGGFTDCLLQHGAEKIFTIDVGTAQLHEKIRNDARVTWHENVNLKNENSQLAIDDVDLIVIDVSFISLKQVLPNCLKWLKPNGHILALVKPQFELDAKYNVKGVVHKEEYRLMAVENVLLFCNEVLRCTNQGVFPSGLKGPKGNQEYFVYLKYCP